MLGIELRRYAKFQVYIFKTDSGKMRGSAGVYGQDPISRELPSSVTNVRYREKHQEESHVTWFFTLVT